MLRTGLRAYTKRSHAFFKSCPAIMPRASVLHKFFGNMPARGYKTAVPRPQVVFLDNHWDAKPWPELTELAPALKDLGYEEILFEITKSKGWDEIKKYVTDELERYQLLNEEFHKAGFDIHNPDDVSRYINQLKRGYQEIDRLEESSNISLFPNLSVIEKKLALRRKINSIESIIKYHPDTIALASFIPKAEALGFEAKAIDLQDQISAANTARKIMETMDERSATMADAIMDSEKSSIAIIGLRHGEEMQRKIIEAHQEKQGKPPVLFMNVYPEKSIPGPYEKAVREGKIHFPLGLTNITGANKTQQIHDAIKKSIAELKKDALQNANHPESNVKRLT